ncbi:uncharacterized protein LOC141899017 [Tubulanus polymorphus]|uniref:uncharacterized protein LOC141899017 n=1 Tax=Tubulanus polymorphus TaxID=672921 RepID=UPI003DA56F15
MLQQPATSILHSIIWLLVTIYYVNQAALAVPVTSSAAATSGLSTTSAAAMNNINDGGLSSSMNVRMRRAGVSTRVTNAGKKKNANKNKPRRLGKNKKNRPKPRAVCRSAALEHLINSGYQLKLKVDIEYQNYKRKVRKPHVNQN